ncbi:hypothetical protein NKH18_11300 [Streptomyces sp. M10(2022)]
MDYDELELALSESGAEADSAGLRGPAVIALTEIATGARALRAVRHPLGFLCLPMLRQGLAASASISSTRDTASSTAVNPGTPTAGSCAATSCTEASRTCRCASAGPPRNPPTGSSRCTAAPAEWTRSSPPTHWSAANRAASASTVRGDLHPLRRAVPRHFGRESRPGRHARAGPLHTRQVGSVTGPARRAARTMTRGLCGETQTARIVRTALRRIDDHVSA